MKSLHIETNLSNVIGKTVYTLGLGLMVSLLLTHCTNNPSEPVDSHPIITDYIKPEPEIKACWYSNQGKDSLKIGSKKYVISNRSRFQKFEQPTNFGDTIAEGDVILVEPVIFLTDTKTFDNFVFNHCEDR